MSKHVPMGGARNLEFRAEIFNLFDFTNFTNPIGTLPNALPGAALDAHLACGAWRGKAGGYNYADCVEAGWPLACDGDPETVMGLPSRLVLAALAAGGGR